MEYVDESDESDEQQNCKYDTNDEPCGYALGSSVLDDSNLNVLRHFGPTNDFCTLGKCSVCSLKLAGVCNTVYDPGDSILSSGDECVNLCEECSLVEGTGVTVGQLECAVSSTLNLVENHICRSSCQSGKVGCVQNGTCRNGYGNIIVGNGCFGVFNGNDNVGCGHCELAVGYCNSFTGSDAVDGCVNLDCSGITGLIHNGNANLGACGSIGLISSCITVGVYVVVTGINSTVELDFANARHKHIQSQAGQGYVATGSGVGPNVAGLCAVNVELQSCELAVSPLCNGLFVRNYQLSANVEAYGNLCFGIVYPEQGDILAEVVNDGVLAEPIPTGLAFEALRNKCYKSLSKCVLVSRVIGDGVLSSLVEYAVYIVVYVVNRCPCIVLSSNGSCGHSEVDVALGKELTANLGSNILIAGQGLLCNGDCNSFARLVPTVSTCDCCNGSRGDQIVVFVISVGINVDVILVNDGVGGEVRCVEYDSAVFNGNAFACLQTLFAVNINKGLFVVGGLSCEGQNDLNAFAKVTNFVYTTESKLDGFLAAGSVYAAKLIGEGNGIAGSFTNKGCNHCVRNGYLLCICCCSGKNKALALCYNLFQERFGKLEVQTVCVLVPVLFNSDNVVVTYNIKAYETVNLNLGLYGRLGPVGSGLLGSSVLGLVGSRLFGGGLVGSGLFGSGIFNFFFYKCLYNDILCGHSVNEVAGCGVYPALGTLKVGIIQHLIQVGAYGKQGVENNDTVVVFEGYTVEVSYLNGNIKAGGHVSSVCHNHIKCHLEQLCSFILAGSDSRYARAGSVECLVECLFYKCSCIKGNGLCKYKGGVACVEVHQAVVCDYSTESGCHQTVGNTDGVALNKTVNSVCVFYLINNSGVEVCERIGGSCCCLEQIFHIEIVACNVAKLIDNVVNGVIEVAVNLCGQTVGNLNAGNVFELFYKYFKGRNGCECINKVLCFEVVGEIVAGNSFNVREENLCVTGSESSAVYFAKECGIYCFENSNDLFNGEFLCECDEVIGLCCVSGKNLIFECIHFGIGGVCHLLEGDAENACKLGRNLNVSYQLAVGQTNVANLIKQSGKLCCRCTDLCGAGSENKVKVDLLGFFNLTVEVGDCEACGEQLAAVINVCKLVECGNKIFEGVDQFCGQQLEVTVLVLSGDNNTVDFDFGNGLLNGCNNAECLDEVSLKIELAKKLLCNAGFVNNLNKLLSVNLGNECTNVDSLDQAFGINNLGDFAVLNDALSNRLNVKGANETLEVGYVLNNGLVAANRIDNGIGADSIDSCIVALQAVNNVCRSENAAVDSSCDLVLNNVSLNEVSIAVYCSQLIYVDNVVGNEFIDLDNAVVEEFFNVNNACSDKSCEVGEQRCEQGVTKQQNLNVHCCRVGAVAIEKLLIDRSDCAVCKSFCKGAVCCKIVQRKKAVVYCFENDCHRLLFVNVCRELFLNILKQANENVFVGILGEISRETIVVVIYESIKLSVIYILISQSCVADNGLDVGKICSCFNVDTVELYSLIKINDVEELCGLKIQSQIHELLGVVIDESIGIDVIDCLFNIALVDVVHKNINVLNVGLQIHILEQANETLGIYTSEKLISIETSEKRFCIDIADNRLSQSNNLLFGKNCQDFCLGQNVAEATAGRHALEQSLNVAILDVSEQRLRINGNGDIGGRYVIDHFLISLYLDPLISQRTDRQNCQNSYDR